MSEQATQDQPLEASVIDQLRWRKFPVLNDGFIVLDDVMGDDSSVVKAARVSYGQGTRHTSDDRQLIRFLMRHRHTTPFEMAELKFLVRVPMDCWRQWIRHRMASVNEYSTRYSEAIDSQQTTKPDEWRLQSGANKQGSCGQLDDVLSGVFSLQESALHETSREVYDARIRGGVAREQARKDLPLSTYTEAYWKIDLHNLFHFLALRMDSHAQLEIRSYATIIGREIVAKLFPLCWSAFEDYRLNAMQFTALDRKMLAALLTRGTGPCQSFPASIEQFKMHVIREWSGQKQCRERDECLVKFQQLGLVEHGS